MGWGRRPIFLNPCWEIRESAQASIQNYGSARVRKPMGWAYPLHLKISESDHVIGAIVRRNIREPARSAPTPFLYVTTINRDYSYTLRPQR